VTSNQRRRPAVVSIVPEPAPVVPAIPWTARAKQWLRRLWWEFNRSDDVAAGDYGVPANTDVLLMVDNYRCGMCGGSLQFDLIKSERELARQRYAIGECIKTNCRNQGLRLRVPVQVIRNCELMD